jgi:spore coat polysaccharide biosynthesis protein SpsF
MTAAPTRVAFVQARMSSARFPGKILAPFDGRPLIASVIDRVRSGVGEGRVVLATSTDPTDDPLAAYVASLGVAVFRGGLDDVVGRFQACLKAHPCEWFYRICGDSPLLDPALLSRADALRRDDVDIVTNIFPRTFAKGQSVELIRARTFAAIDPRTLSAAQREHVTQVYYERPDAFRIVNFVSATPPAEPNMAVDTVDDLRRLSSPCFK